MAKTWRGMEGFGQGIGNAANIMAEGYRNQAKLQNDLQMQEYERQRQAQLDRLGLGKAQAEFGRFDPEQNQFYMPTPDFLLQNAMERRETSSPVGMSPEKFNEMKRLQEQLLELEAIGKQGRGEDILEQGKKLLDLRNQYLPKGMQRSPQGSVAPDQSMIPLGTASTANPPSQGIAAQQVIEYFTAVREQMAKLKDAQGKLPPEAEKLFQQLGGITNSASGMREAPTAAAKMLYERAGRNVDPMMAALIAAMGKGQQPLTPNINITPPNPPGRNRPPTQQRQVESPAQKSARTSLASLEKDPLYGRNITRGMSRKQKSEWMLNEAARLNAIISGSAQPQTGKLYKPDQAKQFQKVPVKKEQNKKAGKTRITYSDGTTEIVDGLR